MHPAKSKLVVLGIAIAVALGGHVGLARVEVRVEHDKAFDFSTVRTWAWNPEEPGVVKMARTPDDEPEVMRRRFEPTILDAVATELAARGLQQATSAPDVTVKYFVLLTTNISRQTMGQFLPSTTAWALPPFAPATQSMKVMNQGSLVLDLNAQGTVVWRGVAEAEIKTDTDDKKRQAVLREAIHDLLRRYPPRK